MASVSVEINGQSYSIACEDGQEERVSSLGRYINKRLQDIAGAGAARNDSQLMVLTSLVLTDELFELKEQLQAANGQIAEMEAKGQQAPAQEGVPAEELQRMRDELMQKAIQREAELAFSISEIAEDIQGLAKRLKSV